MRRSDFFGDGTAETHRQSHGRKHGTFLVWNKKVRGCEEEEATQERFIHLSRLKEPRSLNAPAHQVEGTKRKVPRLKLTSLVVFSTR